MTSGIDHRAAEQLPRVRRLRVLWNEGAGQKGGLSTNGLTRDEMTSLMARHGLGDELVATESPDDAAAQARDAVQKDYDVVVAAGGDGTVGIVAAELVGSRTALAILPLGSVMNIPRMLGLPRDVDAAASVLVRGEVRAIDVGEIVHVSAGAEVSAGCLFYEAASVGMNAAMFREAQRIDEGDYGSIVRTLFVALRYRPARVTLRLDKGTLRTRALMVTISNGPYTGLGLAVAPDARVDDGLFDVRVFKHYSKWELLRHMGSIAFGRHKYVPHVRTFRSAAVRVESARPLPARADSHDLGTTPFACRVQAGALRVVLEPRDAAIGGD